MKKIINIAIVLAAMSQITMLNSCNDAINIDQPGQIDDKAIFTDVSNLNSFLVGSVYASLDLSNEILFSSVFTDEVKPGDGSGGQNFDSHRLFLDPSNGFASAIWISKYNVINNVNRLLEGAKLITPQPSQVAQYNNILAQARAVRAFAYLDLETYYSPNMEDPNALGVIIVDGIPETDVKLPRSTNAQVYDVINADLDYARGILTYDNSTSARYYVGKGFVNAVSARFNLYRGNLPLAKTYALDVVANSGLSLTNATPISNAPSGPFSFPTPSATWNSQFYAVASSFNPYRNLWNDSARGEIIFSLNRLATGNGASIGTIYNTNTSNTSGAPLWFMGRNLFNAINVNGDIRRYAFVDPSSIISPTYATDPAPINSDKLIIDKYPGITSAATRNDLKVFRLSEMKFILAECEVPTSLTNAANYIKEVRVARDYVGGALLTPVYATPTQAYADILKERRKELAFEGHRYIDLKRLAVKAGVTMDRNSTDDVSTIPVVNLANGSYKYTLPIPLSEIAGNPTIQQNPGY
ncbi:RagB/SusD family nutrient uptake outer membrane protein [Halpernia sp.]|uniref:RagB/SusD family nutrient uptake outer membrane protein n=1 Tax=Halpernia sp. TaxID=2782209 RepID=UPI003A959DC3